MKKLIDQIETKGIVAFTGVYDVFSATLVAKHNEGIFVSGYGFAASYYGLPDIGFIAWSDIVSFVQRIRAVLPNVSILVDIDDGYVDTEVACHVVNQLEQLNVSGIMLEDQKRPRRCGHFDGKLILELDEYLPKLESVLKTRKDLFVIARTDATDPHDIERRVNAFAEVGADAILVDGLQDLKMLPKLSQQVKKPFVFNQILGGKSENCSLTELKALGVSVVIYSTPCLFAAHAAIDRVLNTLTENDGNLMSIQEYSVIIKDSNALLMENLYRERV